MKHKAACGLLLCGLLLCTGCGDGGSDADNALLSAATVEVLSGTPTYTLSGGDMTLTAAAGDKAAVHCSEGTAEPNTFYEAAVEVRTDGNVRVSLGGAADDLNGESVVAACESAHETLRRVVFTDADGKAAFRVFAEAEESAEVRLSAAMLRPVAALSEYQLCASSDETVRVLFHSADVSGSGITQPQLTAWLDALAAIRQTTATFSAQGLPRVDYCATETFAHYGLSGRPVYICRDNIVRDLQRVRDTADAPREAQNILWGYVHEMCHAADGFGTGTLAPRVFDSEFFAQLECAYVMTACGYRYDGEQTALSYFADKATLKNGVYSDEGFLYRLLELLADCDPTLDGLRRALCDARYDPQMTTAETCKAFFAALQEATGTDLYARFTPREQQALAAKFGL